MPQVSNWNSLGWGGGCAAVSFVSRLLRTPKSCPSLFLNHCPNPPNMAVKLPPINYDKLNHLFTKLPFKGSCTDCDQEFDDETYYFCHQPCHQNKYKETCKPELYDPNFYQCTFCKKVATNFTNLRYHYQYHAARRFQCLKCQYRAHSLAEIRRHVQKHLATKLFPCQLCNKQYPDSKSLKEHLIRKHKSDAAYICSQCVRPFNDVNQFSIHIDKHYKEASREGKEPSQLFDLRTGSTPSGQTVSKAFRIRIKRKKRRTPQIPIEPAIGSNQSLQTPKPALDVSGYQPKPSLDVSRYQPKSSLLDIVKSEEVSRSSAPQPKPSTTNGTKTFSLSRITETVMVQQHRRVNRILMGNPCKFGPQAVPRFVSNVNNNVRNNGFLPGSGTSIIRPSIKTFDAGSFEPPTVGLADFIETE